MSKRRSCLIALSVVLALAACSGDDNGLVIEGGPCDYNEIAGTATIVAVQDADPTANNCKNPVEVVFDFEPAPPVTPDDYAYPSLPDTERRLTVGDGKNPSVEWVQQQGLVEGVQFGASRWEIASGACTPVLFFLQGVDYESYKDTCF